MIAVKTKYRLRTIKSNTDLTDIVQGGQGGGGYLSLITPPFFSSYHASQKNKISTTLRSILLSFDLGKSEVEEREERATSWCHNYLFSMPQLLVSNDGSITEISKVKSRVTRGESSKSRITLLGQMIWPKLAA